MKESNHIQDLCLAYILLNLVGFFNPKSNYFPTRVRYSKIAYWTPPFGSNDDVSRNSYIFYAI